MAKLKINTSDILGKLHLAAIEKVNAKFKGALGNLRKFFRNWGAANTTLIENTVFRENTKQVTLPPDKAAQIRVVVKGTQARKTARDIAKEYMKWFAGIEDFDIVKYVEDDKTSKNRTTQKDTATILGQGSVEYIIDYEIFATKEPAQRLKDITGDAPESDSSENQPDSEDSDVINLNDSAKTAVLRKGAVKSWESEHPFASLFSNDRKEEREIVKESNMKEDKTNKFVKQVAAKKNVAAQSTLESIIHQKVEARIREVLDSSEKSE